MGALQAAGCRIVQVDEPALREGLPLKHAKWGSYLGWAVDAFRCGVGVRQAAGPLLTSASCLLRGSLARV